MFLPQIIITPFSGVLADRWNKKAIIAFTDSIQALVTFLLFVFFLFDIQNILLILGINTFRASLYAFQYPTVHSLIPTMVPQDKLSRINGMNFLFSGVIVSVGPLLAATLLEFFTINQIFLIDVLTYLMALVPFLLIKIPKVQQVTEEAVKKSVLKDFKTGLLSIKMIPGLFAMIIYAMIWNFISRPRAVLIPYFILITHGGTAFSLAIYMTSSQIANIIGSLIMSVKKTWKHKIKINIIGGALYFVCQIVMTLAPTGNILYMIIVLIPAWIIFPITVSTYLTILQTVVSKDKIGRIMSIDHMISNVISPLGALIAGPLSLLIGIRNLFIITGILGILNPLLIWFFTKIRQLEIIERDILMISEEEKKVEETAEPADVAQIIEPIE